MMTRLQNFMSGPVTDQRRRILMTRVARSSMALLTLSMTRQAHAQKPAPTKEVTEPLLRVAVAGGAITEIVYALGAQAMLVGVDTTSTYPSAAAALTKIGYQRALSAEGVLSLHPEVLLASAEAGPPAVLSQIAAAGVKIVTLGERYDVKVVRDRILGTAAALNLKSRGASLLQQFDAQWQVAMNTVKRHRQTGHPAPRVMFILSHGGTQAMVAGRDTAADAMIRYAGAINVMDGKDGRSGYSGYKPLTAESAAQASPDALIITSEGLTAIGGMSRLIQTPGLALTAAAKNHRVLGSMDSLLLLGFGPRLPQALIQLSVQLS